MCYQPAMLRWDKRHLCTQLMAVARCPRHSDDAPNWHPPGRAYKYVSLYCTALYSHTALFCVYKYQSVWTRLAWNALSASTERMGRSCGETRRKHKISFYKPRVKIPVQRLRRNIEMEIRGRGFQNVECTELRPFEASYDSSTFQTSNSLMAVSCTAE